jgi:phage/plasmid-associated DNA primase
MQKTDLFSEIVDEIVSEKIFLLIQRKNGKVELFRRCGNQLIKEQNKYEYEKYIVKKIRKHLALIDSDDIFSEKKIIGDIQFLLKTTDGFIKTESEFLPSPKTISLKNGEFSFATNSFIKDDGKIFRIRRINAHYIEGYAKAPLPELFERLVRNGITNPKLSREENDARYHSFLDCISYIFYPENPCRKFFFIVGVPHCGKTTFIKIMRNIFGVFGTTLDINSLMKQNRPNPELRPDLFGITDKLWLDISEIDKGKKLKSRLIKNLSGNDPIPMRNVFSTDMKQDALKGKFIVVSNFYPQFDERYDNALNERVTIFDWYNSVSDENTIFELAELLSSKKNRARIATFFINRAVEIASRSIQFHPSFSYNPELSLDNKEKQVLDFLDKCITYYDGTNKGNAFSPLIWRNIHIRDFYRAYLNYTTNILNQPKYSALSIRDFNKYLREHFDKYQHIVETRFPNGMYYMGALINNNLINFQLQIPNPGHWNSQRYIPQ